MTRQPPDALPLFLVSAGLVPSGPGQSPSSSTIRPECELGLGCMYSSPSARFSALHTFRAFENSESPHATTACGAPSRWSALNGQGRPQLQGREGLNVVQSRARNWGAEHMNVQEQIKKYIT